MARTNTKTISTLVCAFSGARCSVVCMDRSEKQRCRTNNGVEVGRAGSWICLIAAQCPEDEMKRTRHEISSRDREIERCEYKEFSASSTHAVKLNGCLKTISPSKSVQINKITTHYCQMDALAKQCPRFQDAPMKSLSIFNVVDQRFYRILLLGQMNCHPAVSLCFSSRSVFFT